MLSDEECREIWHMALNRCHPMNDVSVAGVFAARAAYALGVERARKVSQLGRKCVDPKTGFSLTPQPPNGRPMLTPEQREIAIKKLCELCGSAGDVEWIAEFAGQQIDGVLLLPAYKAIQYAKEQPK